MSEDTSRHELAVELPSGSGTLTLQSVEEVELYEHLKKGYVEEYRITKVNDLMLLGIILQQHIGVLRAQKKLSGLEPVFDDEGLPTGEYKKMEDKRAQATAMRELNDSTRQIQDMEKTLGVDKKSRETGSEHSTHSYVMSLKGAARDMGIHISERVKGYEEVFRQSEWRVRLLLTGDAEDQQYHNLTPEKFLEWLNEEIGKLRELDKEFAHERGAIWVGELK